MLITLIFLSFVIGFIAALYWTSNKNATKPASSLLPTGRNRSSRHELKDVLPTIAEKVSSTLTTGSKLQGLRLLTKEEVETCFSMSTWQRLAYEDFKTKILANRTGSKTFPCIYATMGYRSNEHRYVFLNSDNPSEPQNVRLVGQALESYLPIARSLGPNTTLVIMSAPSTTAKSVQEYNNHFWDMLRGLRIYDSCPWPEDVPSKTESEKWTFCYGSEPIFPVMLTPDHGKRYSRHMSVPVIAIQPKWVLDLLLSTPEKRQSATNKVRKLLKNYDSIDISPDLTSYGEPGTSESRQLCLADENLTVKCPYDDFDR